MLQLVGAGPWNFALRSFASSHNFAKITHRTVFMLAQKVFSLFIDAKYNRILAWTWNFHLLFVLIWILSIKWITYNVIFSQRFISTRPWIFIMDCLHQRACCHHFISPFAETESFLQMIRIEFIFQIVCIRRRGMGRFLCKIILRAVPKGCRSIGRSAFNIIKFVASMIK